MLALTLLTLLAIGLCSLFSDVAFTTVVTPLAPPSRHGSFAHPQEVLGANGVACFGMTFGLLLAFGRQMRVGRRAEYNGFKPAGSIVVKEKEDTDISKIAYLQDF